MKIEIISPVEHPPPPSPKSWYNPRHVLFLQLLNILGYVILILFTLLASFGGIFPHSLGSLSSHFPTLITPAPFSLSLWGIICLLATFYVIYQALPRQRFNPLLFQETHLFFFIACILTATWLILLCYDVIWGSLVASLLLLATLILIYLRINRIKNHSHFSPPLLTPPAASSSPFSPPPPPPPPSSSPFPASKRPPPEDPPIAMASLSSSSSPPSSRSQSEAPSPSPPPFPVYRNAFDYVIIFVFFSLYLSWVTLSAILTLTVALKYPGKWDGGPWNEGGWAILVLSCLFLVALVMEIYRRDAAFGLGVAWGLFGIASWQRKQGQMKVVVTSLVLGGLLLGGSLVVLGFKYWRFQRSRRVRLD